MDERKRRLKKEYLQNRRASGVFLIRNMINDKVFVGVGLDLSGIINSHKFQLAAGVHRNRRLQNDWNEFGGESFAFEILDQLEPRADAEDDGRNDLAFLEELWLEKLQPYGARGYNKRKLSREEMLRRIAAGQSAKP
ncbi:MAG TPA: GIY-YIG nuclease family protein [Pyrinomonadaceae bacterium]|nr:GIY-YIG nuclease family protein [Pyrinomonadaceae bacterium]